MLDASYSKQVRIMYTWWSATRYILVIVFPYHTNVCGTLYKFSSDCIVTQCYWQLTIPSLFIPFSFSPSSSSSSNLALVPLSPLRFSREIHFGADGNRLRSSSRRDWRKEQKAAAKADDDCSSSRISNIPQLGLPMCKHWAWLSVMEYSFLDYIWETSNV